MAYYTYQIDDEACSLACFQMLLVNRSKKRRYKRAKLFSSSPFSLSSIEEGAARYRYKLTFYDGSGERIGYPFNEKQPFLALLGNREKGHMVYVRNIKGRYIYIFDPSKGKRRYEKKEFEEIWSGIFGVLEGKKEKDDGALEEVCPPFLGPLCPLLVTLLSVLGEISLLFGFFFFYKDGNILLPSLSFIAFGLSSLSSRALLMNANKKLDMEYLPRTYSENRQKMEESYKRYHFLKRYLLSEIPSAISSFIGALALTTLLSINNPFFLLPVFFSLFLYFLSAFLFNRRFSSKEERLEKLEASFKETRNKEETLAALKEIGDISSSFARNIEYERIIITVGLLSSNLLSLLGQIEVSLNFYLFHLFALFGIYMLFKKAFDPLFEKKEFLIARGHYVEYLSSTSTK